jgi:hypothetical protein
MFMYYVIRHSFIVLFSTVFVKDDSAIEAFLYKSEMFLQVPLHELVVLLLIYKEHIFLRNKESWLSLPFSFPGEVLSETVETNDHPKRRSAYKEFSTLSERHKRRRTQSLMAISTDELTFATKKSLRSGGNAAG